MNNNKEHTIEVPLPENLYEALKRDSNLTGISPEILGRIAITRLLQELRKNEEIIVPSIRKKLEKIPYKEEDGHYWSTVIS